MAWTNEPNPFGKNRTPSLLGVSSVDNTTVVPVAVDPATGRLLTNSTGGAAAATVAINDGVSTSTLGTVAHLTNSNPLAVEIVDGSGTQITSFGGGTQYTDAGTPPTHPVGPTLEFNNAGTWTTVGSANPLPISGTITANAGTNLNTSALALESGGNLATVAGAIIAQEATTSGVKGATVFGAVTTNAPTYTTAKSDALSLDVNGLLRVSLKDTPANTNKLLVTPDSVALPANQSVNVSQINAVTPLMGNGTTGTGSQRVTIASDNTAFSVNSTLSAETTKVIGVTRTADGSGNLITSTTNALDINIKSGNLTTLPVTNAGTFAVQAANPPTGTSTNAPSNLTSAAYEASHVIKASSGVLYGITGYNSRTSSQFIQLFNSTTVPADTTVPVVTFSVPASSPFSIDWGIYGRFFSTGIAVSNSSTGATKTIGSADCFFDCQFV